MNNNSDFTLQLQKTQVTTGSIGELIQKMNEPIIGWDAEGQNLPIEWRGSSWLVQIASLGKTCFIVGERGSGKRTAASLAEFDCDFELIKTTDMAELGDELWRICGRQLPALKFFQEEENYTKDDKEAKKPQPIRAKTKGLQAWICPACDRKCRVLLSHYRPHGEDDSDDIAMSVSMVEGPCPLKFSMLAGSIDQLHGKKLIVSIEETSRPLPSGL